MAQSDANPRRNVTKGGGVKPDKFDPKDHYYQAQALTEPTSFVNLRQEHAEFATKIYDQSITGSCTANAAAAAFWHEEKAGRVNTIWGSAGPSRLFIYWNARGGYLTQKHGIVDPQDDGSSMREAMKSLAVVGACPEIDCPFIDIDAIENEVSDISDEQEAEKKRTALKDAVVNAKPSNVAYKHAANHKISYYYRLDPDRPEADDPISDETLTTYQKEKIGLTLLNNLKRCLSEGFPVAFAFWYYLPDDVMFDKTVKPYVLKDTWQVGNGQYPRHTSPSDLPKFSRLPGTPGHSVLAIGYDDVREQVLVQNSWGTGWSNGTFWMPYAWITDFKATNDFWTIRHTDIYQDQPAKTWRQVHQEITAAV